MSPIIRRGEIYLVDWNPARGSEQKGRRPALIIQNNIGNEYSATTIVASISTKFSKIYPFQVFLNSKESGLDDDSIIDLAQIMTISKTRLLRKIGQAKSETMQLVNEALMHSLNII